MSTFDAAAAARARDAAIARVSAATDPAWKAIALGIVYDIALEKEFFTADLIWFRLERDFPGVDVRERRALGSIMRIACSHKLITNTDEYRRSVRVECHRRPLMVWQSLILDLR